MKKNVWVGVSFTLLSSLQSLASEKNPVVLSNFNLASVEVLNTGDYKLMANDGSSVYIKKEIIDAIEKKKLSETPQFKGNAPCVARGRN